MDSATKQGHPKEGCRRTSSARSGLGPVVLLLGPWWLLALPHIDRTVGASVPRAAPVSLRIDLNRADWPELMLLPGVGEMRARDIVRFRERGGSFTRIEDVDAVPGIGPQSVDRMRAFVRIDGQGDRSTER